MRILAGAYRKTISRFTGRFFESQKNFMIDLNSLTIVSARKKLDAKEFSAVDLASAYLEEIKKKNSELNAYLEVYDDVLEQPKSADEKIGKGESYPLLGI